MLYWTYWTELVIILFLFWCSYPSLRVAYIDEVEQPSKDTSKKTSEKLYYSALVKANIAKTDTMADPGLDPMGSFQNLDQVTFRYWLILFSFFFFFAKLFLCHFYGLRLLPYYRCIRWKVFAWHEIWFINASFCSMEDSSTL